MKNPFDHTEKTGTARPSRATLARLAAIAGVAGASLVAGSLVLPEAAGATSGATSPTSSAVSSSASALTTTVPDLTVTTGASSTNAADDGALSAKGAGVLAPSPSGEADATAAPGQSNAQPKTCGGSLPAFPAPFKSIVTSGVACGSASADSGSATNGTASATGEAASLDLNLTSVLSEVVTPASSVAKALQGVLGTLPSLPTGGEPVSQVLQQVDKDLTGNLSVDVAVGPSSSVSKVTAAGWTTTAKATGTTITLLPKGGLDGAPLAKIIVGGASATASVERAPSTGGVERPVASDSPALVTIEVDAPAVGPKTYSLVPGQSMTILSGTPLQSTISVASGSVSTAADGAETAQAAAVSVSLAEGVEASPSTAYNGGLHLALADATATASPDTTAAPAPVPTKPAPKTVSAAVPNATVPHTGLPWAGAAPVLAGGALAGAGLLWWPRLRRRLRPSSSRSTDS